MNFREYLWPLARLGEGMEVLAQRAALRPVSGKVLVAPETLARAESTDLPRWMARNSVSKPRRWKPRWWNLPRLRRALVRR